MVRICLSSKGLAHIPPNSIDSHFTFHINAFEYHCPSFIADFLSPRISQFHRIDPTISNLRIETENASAVFPGLLSLGFGSSIEFPHSSLSSACFVAAELGNAELSHLLLREMELTCETVFNRLRVLESIGANCDLEIAFISTHFSEFSDRDFEQCTFSEMSRIVGHDCLRIDNEDVLYDFVRRRFRNDSQYFSLLPFVRFEFLSEESMGDCLRVLRTDCFDRFDRQVWAALTNRFVLPITQHVPVAPNSLACPFSPQAPLEGIIARLTRQCGRNVVDAGIVDITASRALVDRPDLTAKNVADLTTNSYFWSVSEPNSWICWDFKDLRVLATAYSIRTYFRPSGAAHLKNWVLEGIAEGQMDWVELDRRENNGELNEAQLATFAIAGPCEVKALRIRQVGPNHNGNFCLLLAAFEVFGVIRETRK